MSDLENTILKNEDDTPIEFDKLPRHTVSNPLNYDEITLKKRERELKAIMKDYPDANPATAAMCWDYLHSLGDISDEEALAEINRLDALPPKQRDTQK